MSDLLVVKDLKKYFSTPAGQLRAVDGVSFTIPRGRTMGVVGESGCGKSTLGRAILQLHKPTGGEVLFDGQDVAAMSKAQFNRIRPRMQMIFQDPYSSLNGRMTVQQLIAEPLIVNKVCKNRREIDEKVEKMMDTVGLAKRLTLAYPHELDGGRRQRIGVARALATKPEFIVCDEPVSALDVSIQAQIINLLEELQEKHNLTFLFISHDLSVVEHISDTVGVMYLGSLVEYGKTEDIFRNPLHPYTKALFSAIPVPDPDFKMKRIVLEGSIPSPANPPKGCKFHTRCANCMACCKEETPVQREIEPGHYVVCHLYDK